MVFTRKYKVWWNFLWKTMRRSSCSSFFFFLFRRRFADAACVTKKHLRGSKFPHVYLKTALTDFGCQKREVVSEFWLKLQRAWRCVRSFLMHCFLGLSRGWGEGVHHCKTLWGKMSSFSTAFPLSFSTHPLEEPIFLACVTGHVVSRAVLVLALAAAAWPTSRTSNR